VDSLTSKAEDLRRYGQTVILAAVDGKAAGLIAVADPIKPSAREAVSSLKRSGLRLVMLTGDNRATAEAIAKELGIAEFEAEVLPEQKLSIVKKLQAEGRIVAMACAGSSQRWHCHGYRHGCGHGERRHHADQR
jgi:Cu+-exporting ATPase